MSGTRIIRIKGGGIAGLTAALNLQKDGFDVEIHESGKHCGKRNSGFQFLENWTLEKNVLDFLEEIHVDKNFYCKPWNSQEFLSPTSKSYVGKSDEALLYLVKRGPEEDSIDSSLERQTTNNGIRIIYQSNLDNKEADIIARGAGKPFAFCVKRKRFELERPDVSIVLLDNTLSHNSYSYFIVNDGKAEIACCNPHCRKDCRQDHEQRAEIACCNTPCPQDRKQRFETTVRKFEEILKTKIDKAKDFSDFVSFGNYPEKRDITCLNKCSPTTKKDNTYYVGEAAGFQDYLGGFGMVYAFQSGYYAAKSISEEIDYDELWKSGFQRQLRISLRNRILYDKLSNKDFEAIICVLRCRNYLLEKLQIKNDFRSTMKKFYGGSIGSTLLREMVLLRKRVGRVPRKRNVTSPN